MKKISYYLPFLLLFFAITFTSCDDESLEGEFFTTPDGQDVITPSSSCEEATDNFIITAELFVNTSIAADNYFDVCQSYRASIEDVLANCEFTEFEIGQFQQALDFVGDCMPDLCEAAEITSFAFGSDYVLASEEEQLVLCPQFVSLLEQKIEFCGDEDGATQSLINSLVCSDCGAARQASEEAQAIFEAVDPSEVDAYMTACGNYSIALQEEIVVCGDSDGNLQAIIDNLGDCVPPEDDGPVQMSVDDEFKNFNVAEAPINGSTFEVTATDVDVSDTFEFTLVLQQTGMNVIQNVVLTIEGVAFTPVLNGDTQFTSTITENDGSVIIGTFNGPMMNADGDVITITGGIINIEV